MSSRKPIVAGNWKMNTTIPEGLALIDDLLPRLQLYSAVERIVCPPFVSLAPIAERLKGTDVAVGAQNLYAEFKGAFEEVKFNYKNRLLQSQRTTRIAETGFQNARRRLFSSGRISFSGRCRSRVCGPIRGIK